MNRPRWSTTDEGLRPLTTNQAVARVLLAAACGLAVIAGVPAARVAGGLALAAYLPGDALMWASGSLKSMSRLEGFVWRVGLALSTTILGGVLLDLVGGITRTHWVILWLLVIGSAYTFSVLRSPAGTEGAPGGVRRVTRLVQEPRWLLKAAALGLALGVSVAAVTLSVVSDNHSSAERRAAVWLVPNKSNSAATLGIQNVLGQSEEFSIVVSGPAQPQSWQVNLANQATWTASVDFGTARELVGQVSFEFNGTEHHQSVTAVHQ